MALLAAIGVFVACSLVLLGTPTPAAVGIAVGVVLTTGLVGVRNFGPQRPAPRVTSTKRAQARVPAVEIRNFTFAYPKNPTILNIPYLKLEGPRMTAIVGESGVGKSSLVGLIAAQEQLPYNGSLKVLGQEWKDLATGRDAARQAHRRKIGYIPQRYGLLPNWTVNQTLEQDLQDADISKAEIAGRIERALQEMGIANHQRSVIRGLSGGQQQRVAIARMLARQVSLIIADEPTANLDEQNTRDVVMSLRRAGQDALALIVTHETWVARQCDDMIVLESGKVPAYYGPQPSMAITTRENGQLEIWKFRTSSSLEHLWQSPDIPWSSWATMGPPQEDLPIIRLTGGVADGSTNYEILAVDAGGVMWRRSWTGSAWRDWVAEDLRAVRSVSMSSVSSTDREWWATLENGQVVYKWIRGGDVSPWTELDRPQGRRISTVAAGSLRAKGQTCLIAIDTTQSVWHRRRGQNWEPWEKLDINSARAVAMTSGHPNHLAMWVVTNDGEIHHRWSRGDDGHWSDWHSMATPENLPVVSVTGSLQGQDTHDVIVETSDGAHWHRRQGDERWSRWNRV